MTGNDRLKVVYFQMKSRILSRQFLCFLLIFIFPAEMLFLINAVEKQVLISDENLNETGCSLFPIIV